MVTIRLAEPWYLLLLGLIPLALFAARRHPSALLFSDVGLLAVPVRPSWRTRLRWLPAALRALWLSLLVVALAQPQTPQAASAVCSQGMALMFVIDISGSMATIESTDGKVRTTRLDQVKLFVRQLLLDVDERLMRSRDQVGIVAFSRYPQLVCPLTDDQRAALSIMEALLVDRYENRTNIGDALVLAIDRLRRLGVKEKVMVLCSDGAHNVESGMPLGEASRIAEALGIRIHTIGVGSPATTIGADAERDEEALRKTAAIAGGQHLRADNTRALESLAATIAQLEPSPARVLGYRRYRDLFPQLIVFVLAIWLVETLLRRTWLRVLPAP